MAISITRLNASTLKIFVDGKLNALTASKFRREMEKISAGTRIILDFRNLFYISSAGLREIFICRKKYPDMRIENVSRDVNLIFLMTGFEEFIPITLAEDDALKNAVANESNISFKKFLRDKAAFFGDEVAIVTAGEEYTWQEIERCSKIIAIDLYKRNVRQGDRVVICGAKSINWLLAFFAIQKLGAIAVVIDSNLSVEKIAALMNLADAKYFCYGEIPAMTNEKIFLYELQKYSGGKIQAFYSVRDELDFKARLVGKSKFYTIIRAEDPCVMIFTSDTNSEIFSANDIWNRREYQKIFGDFANIFYMRED